MAGGRPREWDIDYLNQEILHWARLPNSLNINAFCHSLNPEIDPDYLLQLVKKNPEFSRTYRIVKTYLAARREEANSEKLLGEKAYVANLKHYDLFLKEFEKQEEKEMLTFEKDLNSQEQKFTNDQALDKLFSNLDSISELAKIKEEYAKLKAEYDEFKRQTDPKHSTSEQTVQYMGGCSPVRKDLLKYT